MKLKVLITQNAPEVLFTALGSEAFARQFFDRVGRKHLGFDVKDMSARAAEFYVQQTDFTV